MPKGAPPAVSKVRGRCPRPPLADSPGIFSERGKLRGLARAASFFGKARLALSAGQFVHHVSEGHAPAVQHDQQVKEHVGGLGCQAAGVVFDRFDHGLEPHAVFRAGIARALRVRTKVCFEVEQGAEVLFEGCSDKPEWRDLEVPLKSAEPLVLRTLASDEGAWANDTLFPVPNVPATAAAITVLRNLRQPIPDTTADWLLSSIHLTSEGGGFLPFPEAPMPDLLSTAVAMHALDGLQVPFEKLKEPVLDFIDTLWTAEGGFHGTWDDDDLDIEYTYYGLLALGHLAL